MNNKNYREDYEKLILGNSHYLKNFLDENGK
jgi:hypothetical protein